MKATTEQLENITDPVNTSAKVKGSVVVNTTNDAKVYAVGDAASDVWNDEKTKLTAHTPV